MLDQIIEVIDSESRKKVTYSKGMLAAIIGAAMFIGFLIGLCSGKSSCAPKKVRKSRKRKKVIYEYEPDSFGVPAEPCDDDDDFEEDDIVADEQSE